VLTKIDAAGQTVTETHPISQATAASAAEVARPVLSTPSPDATKILRTFEDGSANILNVANGSKVVLNGHTAPVLATAWAPTGNRLATASADATIIIWNSADGASLKQLSGATGHRAPVSALGWSADGTMLATASQDGSVKAWQVGLGKKVLGRILLDLTGVASQEITNIAWADDDTKLLVTSSDGSTQILDLESS
jgi:WD40 repeat protein